MRILLSAQAIESLRHAPPDVRRAFEKQLRFLASNLQHPSLHAKKYLESADIWQARVNRNWRFYFTIDEQRLWPQSTFDVTDLMRKERFTTEAQSPQRQGSRGAVPP